MKSRTMTLFVALVLLIAPLAFPAAVDYFLKIDGVDGESKDPAHRGWLDVESWSWGTAAGGAASCANGTHSFSFAMAPTDSFKKLSQFARSRQPIPSLIIEIRGERHQLRNVSLQPGQTMTMGDGSVRDLLMGNFESCATHAGGNATAIKKLEYGKVPAVQQKAQPIADNATFQFEGAAAADKFGLVKVQFMSPNNAMIVVQKGSRGHQILIGLMQSRKKGKATIKMQQPYMEIKFTDLLVSSYQGGGSSGDRPTESLSLNFTKVEGTYADFQDIHYKEQ